MLLRTHEKEVAIISMQKIKVKVEFSGLSRILASVNDVQLSLDPQHTYTDIINMIAEKFPGLVGNVIAEDKNSLFPSNVFSREGKTIVMPEQFKDTPQDGETLILLSLLAGG